jgi:hypothetical protein
MLVIISWVGIVLVIAGVLYSAGQVLWRGPLSGGRRLRSGEEAKTLEPPRGPARSLGLAREWPGLALIGLGAILLLARAAAMFVSG